MKHCTNCGTQLKDDAAFCPNCGTPAAAAPNQAPVQPQGQYQAPVQPRVMNGDADVQANRGIAWLSYCGLLLLVPLFARKNSEYCKFHVKQGATLLAVDIAYSILQAITMAIVNAVAPGKWVSGLFTVHYEPSAAYVIFSVLFWLGWIFIGVLAIIGIVNAATGKKNKLLLVGQIPWVEMLMDKIYAALNK